MSRLIKSVLLALLLVALPAFSWWAWVRPADAAEPPPAPPTPTATVQSSPEAPNITFITSPSPECFRTAPGTDACDIRWNSLSVSGTSGSSVISMTVTIDNQIRAYVGGFFQASMQVPYDLLGGGFRVSCGTPGSGGKDGLGKIYPYAIRARDSLNLSAANYGSVFCPSDIVALAGLQVTGPSYGKPGVAYDFTAAASPITTTLPITYAWNVTGGPPVTATGGVSLTRSFSWLFTGTKTITVNSQNAAGSASASHTMTIEAPVAGLTASAPSPNYTGRPVKFQASVTDGTGFAYTWDFGDSATGSGPSPSHSYASPGVYNVSTG